MNEKIIPVEVEPAVNYWNCHTSRLLPKPNEIWKHFKGNNYLIICLGHHSETQEAMVVYQKIEFIDEHYTVLAEPCIRPLDMFMSEVDHEKYPDVKQKYRFERVENE